MKKVWLFPAAVLSVLVLAACDEPNKQQQPEPQPAAVAPARVDDADLAVKADFEANAAQSISAATYKQDLDAVEKELNGT